MRLSPETLAMVPATVARPHYDRAAQLPGFVHFGVGAFHRAHQAVYTDAAMGAGDRDWAIIGVSPRSAAIADALNPQSGLYSVREKSPAGDTTRIVGAIRQVIVASRSPAEVIDAIASPDTRVVTLTITEKGYCAGPDERLDQAAAGTIANPSSIHGFLAAGLARRRAAKLPGLTLVSCDNLSSNGARLTAPTRRSPTGSPANARPPRPWSTESPPPSRPPICPKPRR